MEAVKIYERFTCNKGLGIFHQCFGRFQNVFPVISKSLVAFSMKSSGCRELSDTKATICPHKQVRIRIILCKFCCHWFVLWVMGWESEIKEYCFFFSGAEGSMVRTLLRGRGLDLHVMKEES